MALNIGANDVTNNVGAAVGARAITMKQALVVAAIFEVLFDRHGWRDGWRDGIYDFLHYHSRTHEVLGIAAGSATVRFGGRPVLDAVDLDRLFANGFD